MEAKRILVAEHSDDDVRLVMEALTAQHLADTVAVVRSGTEVLDYLWCRGRHAGRRGGMPVVLLLELRLPELDGFAVLAKLRQDARLRSLPVVVLTASRAEADIAQAYALGARAFVSKPLPEQELRETIGTLALFWAVNNEPPPQLVFELMPDAA